MTNFELLRAAGFNPDGLFNEIESLFQSQSSSELHLFNWGGGVESTCILLRWILEPETRPFRDWSDCVVVMAQTGDEYLSTQWCIETFILPLFRQHNIRFVQVARAGHSERDGFIILDDSTQPTRLFVEGAYKLSEELLLSGTVPRLGRPHFCAMKFKGFVLDAWIAKYVSGAFGPYIGYNSDETKRVKHSNEYGCRGESYRYPLIDWGWTREMCLQYLQEKLGVIWPKSCCQYCPFQQRNGVIQRWLEEPEAGGFAAFIEMIALCFNPRMALFGDFTAHELLVSSGNIAALENFQQRVAACEVWAVYQVQRIYTQTINKKGKKQTNASRRIVAIAKGTREEMSQHITTLAAQQGKPLIVEHPVRFYMLERQKGVYPALEDYIVLAPNIVPDKCQNWNSFAKRWLALSALENVMEEVKV